MVALKLCRKYLLIYSYSQTIATFFYCQRIVYSHNLSAFNNYLSIKKCQFFFLVILNDYDDHQPESHFFDRKAHFGGGIALPFLNHRRRTQI